MNNFLEQGPMFTPIHKALGLEPSELNLSLIEKAIEQKVKESSDLDWKLKTYNTNSSKAAYEPAKDIAAMANSGGGWIIFGVSEDPNTSAASKINPVDWTAADEQRLRQVAFSKINPPVQNIEFFSLKCSVNDNSGFVTLMNIPDSPDAPHLAIRSDHSFIAPVRNGSHTMFMSERDIERAFRARFRIADNQENLLQREFDYATQSLRADIGAFIAFAAVPLQPKYHSAPFSREIVHNLSLSPPIPILDLEKWPGFWNQGRIVKGMRQWVVRSNSNRSIQFRKYLHDNGTTLGVYQLGNLTNDHQAIPYYPVGLPQHCRSKDIEAAIIDFISILQGHARERRVTGGYQIRSGLVGLPEKAIYIRSTEDKLKYLTDAQFAEPIYQFQPVTTFMDPLVPTKDLVPQISDFALDLVNHGGVEFLELIPNPEEIFIEDNTTE